MSWSSQSWNQGNSWSAGGSQGGASWGGSWSGGGSGWGGGQIAGKIMAKIGGSTPKPKAKANGKAAPKPKPKLSPVKITTAKEHSSGTDTYLTMKPYDRRTYMEAASDNHNKNVHEYEEEMKLTRALAYLMNRKIWDGICETDKEQFDAFLDSVSSIVLYLAA